MWSFVSSLAEQSKEFVAKATAATGDVAELLKQKAIDNVDTFEREKDKFTAEEEEPERDDALPWEFTNPGMGVYIEEMQDIIRKLSQDDSTFTQSPPEGVEFEFNLEAKLGTAARLLEFDPGLSKARFRLVPRAVKEAPFWRNYFYRVSVIRDSYRLMGESARPSAPAVAASSSGSTPVLVATSAAPVVAERAVDGAPRAQSEPAPPAIPAAAVANGGSVDPPASSVVGAPIVTAGGSESSFVMVEEEEQDPDAFESALEAALREGEEGQGTSAAGGGPLIGADADEDEELQRRIEAELQMLE